MAAVPGGYQGRNDDNGWERGLSTLIG